MPADGYGEDASRYALRSADGTDGLAFAAVERRVRESRLTGRALDAGCGAGRSTRFLQSLGFDVTGLDVDEAMLDLARRASPELTFRHVGHEDRFPFRESTFDVVLSTWVVLELKTDDALRRYLAEVARVLRTDGTAFVVADTPEFYAGRWRSCEVDFPENEPPLVSGQPVRVRLVPENVVVEDVFRSDEAYREAFRVAGLDVVAAHRPVASEAEPGWFDEATTAPYVVYELARP